MTESNRRRRARPNAPAAPARPNPRDDGAERSWLEDDGVPERSADFGTDLVNLGFISAAIRRSRRLWLGLAVLGLLLGATFWATRPPAPQASTTLLLNVGPEGQPGTAILTDQAVADSRGVAGLALQKLHLHQSIDSLLSTYHADVVTDRVLRITVSAPTSGQAVQRANAVASAFLSFRADQLRTQQALQFAGLDAALAHGQQKVTSFGTQISRVAEEPRSESRRTRLEALRGARKQAESQLTDLTNQVQATKATAEETTAAMVGQSKVLDAGSPLPQSRLKPLILFSGAGLIFGLFLGLAVVIVRAVISDRLRRRDDVALALGAPVRLSIPARLVSRWRPGRRGMAAAHGRDMQRIVAFLRGIAPGGSHRGALAVVPVDDTRVAAVSVVSLASTLAQQGVRVILADLCSGAPAAKLLGHVSPGVEAVQLDGAEIHVVIPDPDEIAPVGPLGHAAPQAEGESPVAAQYASADVLLTLTTLDPSLASDHLRTWATEAVVIVTAGRSSWTRIHAVGELIRLAGTRLVSAVLVGADKWDESLGVTTIPPAGRENAPANGTPEARSAATGTSRFASR